MDVDLPPRNFQALITGLCRQNFYGEDVSLDQFSEEVYEGSGLSADEVRDHTTAVNKLLRKAAYLNLEPAALEAHLTDSSTVNNLRAEHVQVLMRFWRTERVAIHEALLKGCMWKSQLKQLSWRIDVKTACKSKTEMNEPTAIFELSSTRGHGRSATDDATPAGSKGLEAVRFEMNREQIFSMMEKFQVIQDHITNFK